MVLKAYSASDATLNVYSWTIPSSPTTTCNSTKVSQLSSSNWSTDGQDPEGLTIAAGKLAFISEDDDAPGVHSLQGFPLPPVITQSTPVTPVNRFGTEAALGYSSKTTRLYNLQADDEAVPDKSQLYVGAPGSSSNFPIVRLPNSKYADGLGINGNSNSTNPAGLALASSGRNISATNPAGIYRLNVGTGALTLVKNLSASNQLGLDQDTGADFVPGQNGTFYILAEKGAFFRYTNFNATTGAGGTLTKLCTVNLNTRPGETADSDFEGLATINKPTASNPEAPFTFASITGIDFGLAAPIAAGIVLGSLGALAKKLYQ
jgi:hypothetical protein